MVIDHCMIGSLGKFRTFVYFFRIKCIQLNTNTALGCKLPYSWSLEHFSIFYITGLLEVLLNMCMLFLCFKVIWKRSWLNLKKVEEN
jgi:hypothetical protein